MTGIVKRYYKLIAHSTNYLGQRVDLLTTNWEKAAEHYRNGGTVSAGYMQEYSGGRRYKWGKWEKHVPRRER